MTTMTASTSGTPAGPLRAADDGPLELASIVESLSAWYGVDVGANRLVRRLRLDTFDQHLSAAGMTLVHEIAASGERLVLGAPGGAVPVTMPVTDCVWPALASGLPQGSVRDAIAPMIGIRALMVASDERRRVRRLDLRNKDGKTVARVELDGPASPARAPAEVWVRTMRGYDEQAARVTRLLVGLGLRTVEPAVAAARGARPLPALGRDVPAAILLTQAMSDFLDTMRDNLPGLLDDVDTEFLHDFRVAIRRTRATLKLGRPALPAAMRSTWEPAFKWLGDLTTPVRDLDVYELGLSTMAGWLVSAQAADLEPFAKHLRSRRKAERRALVRALKSARFAALVTDWEQDLARLAGTTSDVPVRVQAPDGSAEPELMSAGRLADRAITKAYGRVAGGGGAIGPDSPAQDLHDLRKRCKELRYALEVFAPVIDDGARRRAMRDLKGLQDVLGTFQDTEVQRHALHGFAEEMMADGTVATAVLAMGELIGHLDAEQDRARQNFDVAFARFVRPSRQQMMHRLGGGQ